MSLDIRLPTGLLFGIIGVILIVFGVFTRGSEIYARSLGINVNLIWGVVLIIFSAVMLGLAWRASRAAKRHSGGCCCGRTDCHE